MAAARLIIAWIPPGGVPADVEVHGCVERGETRPVLVGLASQPA